MDWISNAVIYLLNEVLVSYFENSIVFILMSFTLFLTRFILLFMPQKSGSVGINVLVVLRIFQ